MGIAIGLATLILMSIVAVLGPTWGQSAFSTSGTNGKIAFRGHRTLAVDPEVYVMNADGTGQIYVSYQAAIAFQPSWSPDGTKIAFVSHRDGDFGNEIYVMNAADGSGQTRLTNDIANAILPSWSPDGTKIAFTSTRDGNSEIYVMNAADGSGQTNLSNNAAASDSEPSWSPDGTKIAFTSSRDGNSEIYVMNAADGSNQINLSNNAAIENSPSWSPDGTKIACRSDRDGNSEIYVMNAADGSGQTNLSNNAAASDFEPSWSPDGTKIAFVSDRDFFEFNQIVVMNADGTAQINVSKNADNEIAPSWSPDGTKIAFQRTTDPAGIYIMNGADGSGQTRLTNSVLDGDPAWSPDGTKIAFTSSRDGNGEIYVMNAADGSNQINLSNNAAIENSPSWSPDGTKIAFTSSRDGNPGNPAIYVMNAADGSGQTNLSNNAAASDSQPSWSPDGTKIAFTSNRDGNDEIYVMNAADGSNQINLSNNAGSDDQPDFGPAIANGRIIIEKNVVGGVDATFEFAKYTASPPLPVPSHFKITTVNGNGNVTFSNLPAGGYVNITESDPGQSFKWTNLSCQSIHGNNLISVHSPPSGSVAIQLDAAGGGIAKCAFVNTHVVYPTIDIKPGGTPNTIHIKTDKTVPVAILGSSMFNVRGIDVSPLSDAPKFGGSTPQAPVRIAYEDVNADGITDLSMKYTTSALGFTTSDTQGCINGKLLDGTLITGCDSVKIISK